MKIYTKEDTRIKRKKLNFIISVDVPVSSSENDIKDFIGESLLWCGGNRYPGGIEGYPEETDPPFYSLDNIQIKRYIKRKKS